MNGTKKSAQPFILSFRENISLTEQSDSTFLQMSHLKMPLGTTSKGMQAVLQVLSAGGATKKQLMERVVQHDTDAGLPKFFYYIQMFIQVGLICHTVPQNKSRLATIVPFSSAYLI